jgi:hypothetical protein
VPLDEGKEENEGEQRCAGGDVYVTVSQQCPPRCRHDYRAPLSKNHQTATDVISIHRDPARPLFLDAASTLATF